MKAKYITDFVCTYNLIDEYEDSFWLYQIQILQAFNLEQFNDEKVNVVTEQLYEQYKNNSYIIAILRSNHNEMDKMDKMDEMDEMNKIDEMDKMDKMDELTKFRSCFNYNTFYLIHSVLCSIINNMKINEKNYNKIIEIFLTSSKM